jgi:hypothetical protein
MKYRFLIILLQFAVFAATAQEIVRPVRLKSGMLAGSKNLRNELHIADALRKVQYKNQYFTLIQFSQIPDVPTRQALAKEGIVLYDYIPDNTFLAEVSDRITPFQLKKNNISGVFTIDPQNKIAEKLKRQLQQPTPDPDKLIAVSFYGNIDRNTAITELKQAGAQIADSKIQPPHVIFIKAPAHVVQRIAALPFVAYISSQQIKNVPINYNDRGAHSVNHLQAATGRNLQGTNVTLGIGDNGDISSHSDFSGRLINRNPASAAHHGIHVAGTMAGAALIRPRPKGMAPKATIVGQLYSDILVNTPYYISDFNMVLTNNSYHGAEEGCAGEGEYDVLSYFVDAQMNSYPQLLHVFASGNDGLNNCTPYSTPYATVKSGFQCGKNVLTVGAIGYNDYSFLSFSSAGPVYDGRLKPEIVACGSEIGSTSLNNWYATDWGTSMAAPVVTGTLGLLYERYRQLHSGVDPAAALMKAIVCNSAEDVGNPGPDFIFGFGYLNARKSVEAIENNTYFINSINQDGTATHTITGVPAGTAQLKIMLYWNDPAAVPYTATTLVNNLDLTVTTPGSTVHYPLVLNPAAGSVGNAATEGVDNRNNIEQVVINNPPAGNYTITVKGTGVPSSSQEYVVAYEIVPPSITLEYPFGEDTWVTGETEYIRWSLPPGNTNTFTVEYSLDNGSTWNTINSSVPATSRSQTWVVPNSPTNAGLIRVSMNSTVYSDVCDQNITIAAQPVLTVTNSCVGYASLSWGSISGATSYDVMMIKNGDMQKVGSTTSTNYLLGGLNKDSTYYLAVRPVIGTSPARRSNAQSITPSGGACSAPTFDNDFTLNQLVAPVTGRQFTASQLGSVAPQVLIKNLGSVASSGTFDITYQINSGTPVTETSTQSIAAGSTYIYTFTTPYNFSSPGTYTVKTWVTYSSDALNSNDTLVTVIKQLQNPAITLSPSFTEGFESATAQTYATGTRGFEGLDRCDFFSNNSNGRARTFVNSGIARSGIRAVTLDQKVYTGFASGDSLITTFNLGAFTPADQIWLSFYYKNHGIDFTMAGNRVWIRGSENDAWIPVIILNNSAANIGVYQKATPVNITETLANAVPAQTVSTSFQIKFGENAYRSTNSVIPHGNIDDGYTFDDVTLTLANNDLGMLQLVTPAINNVCALSNAEPITVQLKNYSTSTLTNVPISYDINGVTVTETLLAINAGQTLNYTFTTPANLSDFQQYSLRSWVDHPMDDYSTNDTIVYTFQTTPYITSYPYKEDFEANDGHWYAGGINSSWEWGEPAGTTIDKAANGDNAWVTKLNGDYNVNEISYLYSPCFDLSSLSQPVLSFSHIFKTEDNCNCDFHWVEYSTDGANWFLLGIAGDSTNWYDNPVYNAWKMSVTRWHVSSIDIPTRGVKVRFRIGMYSDVAVTFEGIGIDDMHVFDKAAATIYSGPNITSGLSQVVSGNNWIHFNSGTNRVVSINPNGQNLGNTDVKVYFNTGAVRNDGYQYYLNRNIVVQPTNAPTSAVTVRYYFLDAEANALINATGCGACTTISDAYSVGVTQYSNALAEENGSLSDNTSGVYNFILPPQVTIVPYDNGYYAEYQVSNFSEFWINSGGTGPNLPLPQVLSLFNVTKEEQSALLQWTTLQEENTDQFIIERSSDGTNYTVIGTVAASGSSSTTKKYQFTDEVLPDGIIYYRLKMTDKDGKFVYSPVRRINNNDKDFTIRLHPNPVTKGVVYISTSANCTRLELRDAAGRMLKAVNAKGMQNQLHVHDLAKGVYFITVITDSGKKIDKVFIE